MEETVKKVHTYYAYTRPVTRNVKYVVDGIVVKSFDVEVSRASIAVSYDGSEFTYGISVCSADDTFNKKEGRRWAEKRMNAGFKVVPADVMKGKDEDPIQTLRRFSIQLIKSVESNISRYKQMIIDFNNDNPECRWKPAELTVVRADV